MCASKRRAGTCLLGLCHVLAIVAILSFKRSLSRALSIRDHGQQHRQKAATRAHVVLHFESSKQSLDGGPILRSKRYQGASGAFCGLFLLRHCSRARRPTSAASNIAGQAQHSARAYWIGCSRSIIRYTCGQTPRQRTVGTAKLE